MSSAHFGPIHQQKELSAITWLWSFLRPYKISLSLFFICSLVQVAFLISLPISYRIIFDDAVKNHNIPLLYLIGGLLCMGFLLRTIADYLGLYIITKIGAELTVSLRMKLFTHMESLSPDFYRRMSGNDLFNAFSDNIMSIENALVGAMPPILRALILIFFSFLMIFFESWLIGLFVTGLFLLSCFFSQKFHPGRDIQVENFSAREKDFLLMIREFINTHLVIRLYSLLNKWLKEAEQKTAAAAHANRKANYHIYLAPHFFVAGSYLIEMVVILMGAFAVIQGTLTIGIIFSLLAVIAYILSGADSIAQQISPCVRAAGSLRSLIGILQEKPSIIYPPDAADLPLLNKNIIFKNVALQTSQGQKMLDNINLTINAGESIALVGPSGAGKSSILKLLMRLYDPTAGSIVIDDNYDLRFVNEDSLRNQMAVVLQESFLFNKSVRDNIAMGRLNASEADIIKAAQQAGLHDEVLELPEGYDTVIGELGAFLSGGERQQLALARGFIRSPRLLILDEVTSSVDVVTEAEIKKSLQDYAHKCTIVMATHRLHLSFDFDHIYVVQHGAIVEHGTHTELLNLNKVYAMFWEKQSSITLTPELNIKNIDLDYLSKIQVLKFCSKDFLKKLAKQFIVENHEAKKTIFIEGSMGDKFYLIARGEVEVLKKTSHHTMQLIAQLSDGDYFGEISLLTNERHNATVITLTPCLLLTLSRQQFEKLLLRFPELQTEIESIAIKRRSNLN